MITSETVTVLVASMLLATAASKTVFTTSGLVQGMTQMGVYQFLGIPFAEAPTGERRFTKPVWKARMTGIYNATYFRPRCPQSIENNPVINPNDKIDEDCLHLNIYTPINASRAEPKEVMVWIHGGAYIMGSGQDYIGTMLVLYNDVIVVNINYRLGVLGFLSTGDENSVGNFGLWDQTMALEWIRVNIAEFGGDPHSITIFGESAGSTSVTQLAMSPFTEGLFQRVIAESGTASADWSHVKDPEKAAKKLGRLLHCPTESNKDLIHCIRLRPVNDIVHNQGLMQYDNGFLPRYGTDFLPYSPLELSTAQINSTLAKRLAELDFIIGQNTDEGSVFFKFILAPILDPGEVIDDETGITQKTYDSAVIQTVLSLVSGDSVLAEKILDPVKFKYTNHQEKTDGISLSKSFIRLMTDTLFTVPTVQFARIHALLRKHWHLSNDTSGTFVYLYDHRGSWMPKESWGTGAYHGDEIPFVFGYPHMGIFPNVTEEEKQLSTIMMKFWTEFAKTGNPNSAQAVPGQLTWPKFEHDTESYLRIQTEMTSECVGQRLFNDRAEFWLDYFPKQLSIYRQEPVPGQCEEI